MDKLEFLDELTQIADSAKVPELRVYEATRPGVDDSFKKEVVRIAHMVTTIARASKNSTQEIWKLLEQHLRAKGENMNEGLLATFRTLADQEESAPSKERAFVKARDEAK